MIERQYSIGLHKVVVGYLHVNADGEATSFKAQMQAIEEACRRRMRSTFDIVWVADADRHGLTLVRDLISRDMVKSLVVYECSRLVATSEVAKERLENYLIQHNVQFLSVVERVNNRQDLARLIDQAKDGFTEDLLAEWRRNPPKQSRPRKPHLSPRQTLLLKLKAQGMSAKEIAERMGIRPHSIHALLSTIRKRLGVMSVPDAVATVNGSPCLPLDAAKPDITEASTTRPPAAHKPIMPLLLEHVRLLEFLSTGLTIYEVAAVTSIEPERAEALRRQAYLRLGVTNLRDAIAVADIRTPKKKPAVRGPVPRPERLSTEERAEATRRVLDSIFGSQRTTEGMARPFAIGDQFPDDLWLLHYPARGTYFCICTSEEVTGLVCLSTRPLADCFLEALAHSSKHAEGCVPMEVTFDEARQIAKARESAQVLVLVDDPENLRFRYVR